MKILAHARHLVMVTYISTACLTGCSQPTSISSPSFSPKPQPKVIFKPLTFTHNNSFRALHWASDTEVWLGGSKGAILFSNDAGTSWNAVLPPDSLDFRSLWILPNDVLLAAPAGQPANIYRSADKGNTWTITYSNHNEQAFFDAIYFTSITNGYAFSDPIDGSFLLLHTTNGGKSWQPDADIPKALPGEAAFAASNASITHARNKLYIGTGGKTSRILVKDLQSGNWSIMNNPAAYLSEAGGIYALATSLAKENLVGIGGAYDKPDSPSGSGVFVLKNKNVLQLAGTPPSGYRSGLAYLTALDAFISVGTNGSDITYNAGRTWVNINDYNLNTIRMNPSGKIGLAVGSQGRLFRVELNNKE